MNEPSALMLPERQAHIRDILAEEGRVVAQELARMYRVSEDTIRRDLRELAKAGLCKRVYGGALPAAPVKGNLQARRNMHVNAKKALARRAAKLVEPGNVLFLDAGSTNIAIAAELPKDIVLTVATNAPAVALALVDHRKAQVILIGGSFDPEKGGCFGGLALRDAAAVRSDICFLGACGIDAEAGVTADNFEEAALKRTVAQAARSVIVAATADKLGTAASFEVVPAAMVTHLVVDADADRQQVSQLRALDIAVHHAD